MLIPWQRIDSLKSFFFLLFQFLQRTDQISKTDLTSIDDTLKPLIKKTLGLLSNAANEYLYGSRHDGLFSIPLTSEDSDIALIDGRFKLLTSTDKIVQSLAWDELVEVANWRYDSTSIIN